MTVKILTDSTCDLPADVVKALDITVIPLYIHIGNENYADGVDITREAFYQNLRHFEHHPTTAVPSPAKFHALYEALAEEGATEILSIHISETLSGTVNVARVTAAETTSAPVTVLDSGNLSMGTGFLVQTAAELARMGKTVAEILPVLESQIKRTHVWAALDTLEFLRRSGRMNRAISTIGEILQIKPMLKMHNGVSGAERVRTRKAAVARLTEMLQTLAPFEKLAFLHSNALDQAHELQEKMKHLVPESGAVFGVVNPVLGAHLGPGVLGFCAVTRKE